MWRDDHVTTTYHDPVRMLEVPRETWREHIKGLIDHEKTLKNVKKGTDIDDLLDEVYDSITQKIKEKKKAPNFERVTQILGESILKDL